MKRTAVLSLCVGSMPALGALAGTASAALPEFNAPPGLTFTSTSKATLFETPAKLKIKCTADTNKGEILGPKTALMTITFTGCAIPGAGCSNGAPGEIATRPLIGQLGYITREPELEVGLDLSEPAAAIIAEFFCGPTLDKIIGSVIARITPINKLTNAFALKFTQKKGIQMPTNFLGGPIDILENSFGGEPFQPIGLASLDTLHFLPAIKISA